MFLEGERVRLRPAEVTDTPRFLPWINDPEVRHLLGAAAYQYSLAAEEEFIRSRQENSWEAGVFLVIEAMDADDEPRTIGNLEARRLHAESRHAEIGILIGDREYWGRGYGEDAMRTLCRFLFEELDLHRVYLSVLEFNPRARRSYEKVGFVEEGRKREHAFIAGRYYDVIEMGLLRREFEAREAARPAAPARA
ncbi:MAG: GNAT family N-acetyltransferase [Chloroflexi bacterium]|nr:GNAT family N-acetyltransferase [Chloroflexota bacterium]